MRELDDSYVAGLVDADGCIILSKHIPSAKRAPVYVLSVQVANIYKPLLEKLKEQFGGSISRKKPTLGSFFSNKANYHWSNSGNGARRLLKRIQPYLIIKQTQAELGIEFWEKRTGLNGRRPSDKEIALREGFYQAMKKLKTI